MQGYFATDKLADYMSNRIESVKSLEWVSH